MFLKSVQILVISLGAISAFLLSRKTPRKKRWGYAIRVLRQIPFAILFVCGEQWLMVFAAIGYAIIWGIGLKNNWRIE